MLKCDCFEMSESCSFSGVYLILNIENCKCYVGATRNIRRRLEEHYISLRNNSHNNEAMQKDFNEGMRFIAYPISKVALLTGRNQDANLRYYENEAIKLFDSMNPEKGYNSKLSAIDMSKEYSTIHFSKEALDEYVSHKNRPSRCTASEIAKEESQKAFISEMLKRTI